MTYKFKAMFSQTQNLSRVVCYCFSHYTSSNFMCRVLIM